MAENNEKTSTFLEAINKYALEQKNKIESEVEAYKKRELEQAENEILNDAYHMIQNEMAQMRLAISSEYSKKEMELKRQLFKRRQEMACDVFASAKERLLAFTKTDAYPALLESFAKNIAYLLSEDNTVLYIKPADQKHAALIKKAFSKACEVKLDEGIQIGGLRGYNETQGLLCDETLDSRLLDEQQWFLENSNLKVV